MPTLTYKEAESKIIDAYFNDEIKPFDSKFCFCGNLTDNSGLWNIEERFYPGGLELPYSHREYKKMEFQLMETVCMITLNKSWKGDWDYNGVPVDKIFKSEKYEDALFEGMSKALDVLKSIHKNRGEIIDEPLQLKKRELKCK